MHNLFRWNSYILIFTESVHSCVPMWSSAMSSIPTPIILLAQREFCLGEVMSRFNFCLQISVSKRDYKRGTPFPFADYPFWRLVTSRISHINSYYQLSPISARARGFKLLKNPTFKCINITWQTYKMDYHGLYKEMEYLSVYVLAM